MISVKDVLALLDQVPIWKRLRAMPDQMAALEARVAALEGKPIAKYGLCNTCKVPMELIKSEPHPVFFHMQVKIGTTQCPSCGTQDEVEIQPKKVQG